LVLPVSTVVRDKNGWPKIPVILVTGLDQLPSDTGPLQITLAKPFLKYDLDQAVKAALEDPKTRRGAAW
jgi:hypothetical protein